MTTLRNKHYTGDYDPWLAAGLEYGSEPVKYDAPTFHKQEAVKLNYEYPWPFTEKVSKKPIKDPAEYVGAKKPQDAYIKSIIMKSELQRQRRAAEEKVYPIKQQEKLEDLMYAYFKNEWMNQTKNQEIQYEASLRTGADREAYLRQQYELARMRGDMSINNPAVRQELYRQMDLISYFTQRNMTMTETIEQMGLTPLDMLRNRPVVRGYGDIGSGPLYRMPGETEEEARMREMMGRLRTSGNIETLRGTETREMVEEAVNELALQHTNMSFLDAVVESATRDDDYLDVDLVPFDDEMPPYEGEKGEGAGPSGEGGGTPSEKGGSEGGEALSEQDATKLTKLGTLLKSLQEKPNPKISEKTGAKQDDITDAQARLALTGDRVGVEPEEYAGIFEDPVVDVILDPASSDEEIKVALRNLNDRGIDAEHVLHTSMQIYGKGGKARDAMNAQRIRVDRIRKSMYGLPLNSIVPSLLIDDRAKEVGQQLNATEQVVLGSIGIMDDIMNEASARVVEEAERERAEGEERDRLIKEYKKRSKPELQAIAREKGVSSDGTKDDIITRILLGGDSSQPKITDVLSAEKPKPPKPSGKKTGPSASSKGGGKK